MQESFEVSADVSFRKVGDEIFVLSRNDSVVFNLNETGAVIWDGISTGKTVDDIVGDLCGQFEVDAATAQRDTLEIIAALVEKKLVTPQ